MSVKLIGQACPNCLLTSSLDVVDNKLVNCKYCKKDFFTHKTKLKCIINPILRLIQFYTDDPYVIVSIFENDKFTKYIVKKMKYKLG